MCVYVCVYVTNRKTEEEWERKRKPVQDSDAS